MSLNKLEQAIVGAMGSAPKRWAKMSGNQRLARVPEFLLTTEIGHRISKRLGHTLQFEAALGDLKSRSTGGRTRKTLHSKKKFDLAVWTKSGKKALAVIELKKVNTQSGAQHTIGKDRDKIWGALKSKARIGLRVGYLLLHSQAPNSQRPNDTEDHLNQRFGHYEKTFAKRKTLDATRVYSRVFELKDSKRRVYWWGFVLFSLRQKARP